MGRWQTVEGGGRGLFEVLRSIDTHVYEREDTIAVSIPQGFVIFLSCSNQIQVECIKMSQKNDF
jgi:hypothetical protein